MFKNINYPLLFLFIIIARITIKGASIGEAIAVCGIAALYAYCKYLEQIKTVSVNDTVRRDVEDLKSSISSLKLAKTFNRI